MIRGRPQPSRRTILGLAGVAVLGSAVGLRSVVDHRGGPPDGTFPAPRGSGVYVGAGNAAGLATFAAWRGRAVDFAVDYLARDQWSDIESPTWWTDAWSSARVPLSLGVPMLLEKGTTLAAGAAGDYDQHFRGLGTRLVSARYARADLRVGWEMNGDWYAWTAAHDPATWVRFHRRIVDALRSVDGQEFTFTWNTSLGPAAMPAEKAWPGDDFVDHVGVDVYDSKWGDPGVTAQQRWSWVRTQDHGLDWTARFAADHHKPIAVPEWGLNTTRLNENGGGGDDPYYVERLLDWATQFGVVYEAYFDDGDEKISGGQFPTAADSYRRLIPRAR